MSREIIITPEDKEKILELLNKFQHNDNPSRFNRKELEGEINRARVLSLEELPDNVIVMNATVRLIIDEVEEELTLVYPNEADIKTNKISVLSPIGTAILGYSEGSIIEWKVPDGNVKIEVVKIVSIPHI